MALSLISPIPICTLLPASASLVLVGLAVRFIIRLPRLPPGPNPIPILGNLTFPQLFRVPFKVWADQYGDIMTFWAMTIPIVVVNSRAAAGELLEKRTAVTGGRPDQVMADELVGLGMDHSRTNDLALHRQYRRLFSQVLGPRQVHSQWPTQVRETRRAALEILEGPEGYMLHLRRAIGAIAFGVAYGRRIESNDDPMLVKGVAGIKIIEEVTPPGSWLVDVIPILRYLPEWVPFKRRAAEMRRHVELTRDGAFDEVKREMAAGTAKPSLAMTLIQDLANEKTEKYDEQVARWLLWSLFTGGSDTSTAGIQSFLAAMVLHPRAQLRAQAELDHVVGRDRLPTVDDQPQLPYCLALVYETLRWQPVTPFGLPHSMLRDEVYEGYLLPKGTIVLANIWAMTRDERDFPQAEEFRPERWLTEEGKMRKELPGRNIPFTFGFGRRICPGWHLAESNIFAAVVALLWSTSFSIPRGTEIKWRPHNGVQHPLPFPLRAKPRFEGAGEMLRGGIGE